MKTLNFEEMEMVQGGINAEQMLALACAVASLTIDGNLPGFGAAIEFYNASC